LSTLTKILIVLLTVSSLFLCGIIVTYVANAEDYKKEASSLRRQRDTAKQSEKTAEEQLAKYRDESERLQTRLNNQIAALQRDISNLRNDLTIILARLGISGCSNNSIRRSPQNDLRGLTISLIVGAGLKPVPTKSVFICVHLWLIQ